MLTNTWKNKSAFLIVKLPYVAWRKTLILRKKIYDIYTFEIYNGYKCLKIIKLYKFKSMSSSFGRMNSSQTNFDLFDAINAHKNRILIDRETLAFLTGNTFL